jgi:hypothetical protein
MPQSGEQRFGGAPGADREEHFVSFQWNRSEVLGLAKEGCVQCRGYGLRNNTRAAQTVPCNCVLRAIFRACHRKFRSCAKQDNQVSTARLESVHGREHKRAWGLKNEEFMADFVLIAKRSLNEADYRMFRYHFLLGADWKLCCGQLGIDRGTFFHMVYRIEERLGRIYRELQPYGLFPLDEYFGGCVRTVEVEALEPTKGPKSGPMKGMVLKMPPKGASVPMALRPPLRRAA